MDAPPAYGHNLQHAGPAASRSSSPMSSPPAAPISPAHDNIIVRPANSGGGVAAAASAVPGQASNSTTINANAYTTSTNASSTGPPPVKRQRKKKEPGPEGEEKVPKPRKPRAPKDKTTTGASRSKKIKTEDSDASTQPRQSTIKESFQQPSYTTTTAPSIPPPQPQHRGSDSFVHSSIPASVQQMSAPISRPFSSGQNYDPIRGSTKESVPPRPSNPPNGTPSAHASPHANRASASPAIASLIDPPTAIKTIAAPIHSPPTNMQQPSFVQSPPPNQHTSTFAPPSQPQPSPPTIPKQTPIPTMDGAMDIEPQTIKVPSRDVPEIIKAPPSKSSSSGPTPKAARPTPPPAPKGTGSGLLSSADLFGGPSNSEPTQRKGVNIDLHIPLDPRGGNTVNIAQEIVKKYGRDALNPRAAAHREQLLRVAMEQNKFTDSNDDMSVDLMSEMEGDSNVEMGGMDDEKSNTGLETDKQPARKRRKKVEEYDKEDDFIDDTEMAWQEQAAVAKDGFFVYSGPLVPEGEKAQVESAAPTRGRGSRSRARGGRSAATTGTTHASLADNKSTNATSAAAPTKTRARTSRGTGAPRKPRITKADRERMEAEKIERERAATSGTHTIPASGVVQTQQQPQPQPQMQSYVQPTGNMV